MNVESGKTFYIKGRKFKEGEIIPNNFIFFVPEKAQEKIIETKKRGRPKKITYRDLF